MEGDAGSGRLNPTPPTPTADDAAHSAADEAIDDKVTTAVDETAPADAEVTAADPVRRPSRLDGGRWLAGIGSATAPDAAPSVVAWPPLIFSANNHVHMAAAAAR